MHILTINKTAAIFVTMWLLDLMIYILYVYMLNTVAYSNCVKKVSLILGMCLKKIIICSFQLIAAMDVLEPRGLFTDTSMELS